MALTQFMGQVDNPQVAFRDHKNGLNKQQEQLLALLKRPTTLIEVVSATIEMESYLKPKPSHVAQVEPEQSHTDTVIAQDDMMGVLKNIMVRLEKLEPQASGIQSPGQRDLWCPTIASRRVTMREDVEHHRQGPPEIKARPQSHSSQSATPTASMVELTESKKVSWLTQEQPSPC